MQKPESKHYKVDRFRAEIQRISDQQVSMILVSSQTLNKYSADSIELVNINYKGLCAGFEKHEWFKLAINELQEQQTCLISVAVRTDFQIEREQKISLCFQAKLTQAQLMLGQLKQLAAKTRNLLQTRQVSSKCYKFVESKDLLQFCQDNQYDMGECHSDQAYDICQFESMKLPSPGTYYMTVSMLINPKARYAYFYMNRQYATMLGSNACVFYPNADGTTFYPLTMCYRHEASTEDLLFRIFTYDLVDYPFKARNILITAEKIQ